MLFQQWTPPLTVSPQVPSSARATLVKVSPLVFTRVGVRRTSPTAPSPMRDWLIQPQQASSEAVVMPQVLFKPRKSLVKASDVCTGVGVKRSVCVLSPSWPTELSPQQKAWPPAPSAQVCRLRAPTAKAVKPGTPVSIVGVRTADRLPVPASPRVFSPQQ